MPGIALPQAAPPVQENPFAQFFRQAMTGTAAVKPGMGKLGAFATGGSVSSTLGKTEKDKERAEANAGKQKDFENRLKLDDAERKGDYTDAQIDWLDARSKATRDGKLGPGGKQSVWQQKLAVYRELYPDDPQKAADLASGRKAMSDTEIRKSAAQLAQREAQQSGISDPKKVQQRTQEFERYLRGTPNPLEKLKGSGDQKSPYSGFTTQDELDAIPSGQWIIDPRTGNPIQKK